MLKVVVGRQLDSYLHAILVISNTGYSGANNAKPLTVGKDFCICPRCQNICYMHRCTQGLAERFTGRAQRSVFCLPSSLPEPRLTSSLDKQSLLKPGMVASIPIHSCSYVTPDQYTVASSCHSIEICVEPFASSLSSPPPPQRGNPFILEKGQTI